MAYIGKVIVPSNKLLAQMNLQRRTGGICWEGHCALKQAHWPSKRYDGVVLLLIRPCAHPLLTRPYSPEASLVKHRYQAELMLRHSVAWVPRPDRPCRSHGVEHHLSQEQSAGQFSIESAGKKGSKQSSFT